MQLIYHKRLAERQSQQRNKRCSASARQESSAAEGITKQQRDTGERKQTQRKSEVKKIGEKYQTVFQRFDFAFDKDLLTNIYQGLNS